MRSLSFWVVLLLFSTFSLSCTEQEDVPPIEEEPKEEEVTKDEYYVQYEVGGINQVIKFLSATTPWGTHSLTPGTTIRSWSETYGPVYQGFSASIMAGGTGSLIRVKIRVSKNGGPFALQSSQESSGMAHANYTIP